MTLPAIRKLRDGFTRMYKGKGISLYSSSPLCTTKFHEY